MHCTQISKTPEIYEIVVPFANVSTNATNCYVVRDGEESLVIDVGAPSETGLAILDEALDDIGVDRAKMSFFLTHFHLDHAGLADALIPSGAKLYVSEREYLRTRPENARAHGRALQSRLLEIGASDEDAEMAAIIQEEGSQYVSAPHEICFVAEGDTVKVGSLELRVIDTSGHTAGHLSLYEPETQTLFGGDHMLFVISPSIDYFGEGTDGLRAYLSNLEKMKHMPIQRLLHAHGEYREDHVERIDWLLLHHQQRLDEACAVLEENRGLSGIDLIRALTWNVPADSWEGIAPVQRAIIITQGLVILDHLVSSGRLEALVPEASADGSKQDRSLIRYRLKSQ